MTDTILSSATREVVLGFDRPFVIIGERINPTGRKLLAEEMRAGDFSRVERDVIAQVEAGAHMLDVNAGIPLADEPAILAHTIRLVQSLTDLPLSIDSSIVEALEAGLAAYVGKPLVNSVTGEEERLERVLPLIKKYGAAVVAISNDDTGISEDPDVRFAVAKRIVERAADHGIPASDIVVDPLVMPIGAMRDGRSPGLRPGQPAARGAEGQFDLRRVERELRAPEPRGHQRGVPAHGHRIGHDLGHHQPDAAGPQASRHGRRRPHGQRPRLRPLDPRPSRTRPGRRSQSTPGEPPLRDRRRLGPSRGERPADHLHAVRPARDRAGRHDRPGCGADARRGHRLGLRRARHLRPLPGDPGRRPVRQARHHLLGGPPLGVRRARVDLPCREGPGLRPPAVVYRHGLRRPPHRCPAREPGPPPGRAQGPRRPRRSRSTRSSASTTSRSCRRTWPHPPATSPACSRRSSGSGS